MTCGGGAGGGEYIARELETRAREVVRDASSVGRASAGRAVRRESESVVTRGRRRRRARVGSATGEPRGWCRAVLARGCGWSGDRGWWSQGERGGEPARARSNDGEHEGELEDEPTEKGGARRLQASVVESRGDEHLGEDARHAG